MCLFGEIFVLAAALFRGITVSLFIEFGDRLNKLAGASIVAFVQYLLIASFGTFVKLANFDDRYDGTVYLEYRYFREICTDYLLCTNIHLSNVNS